jgi:tagatose-6-phosphate ketose/aldose isomerase
MDEFGLSGAQLDSAGAHWTAREILQQPHIWLEIQELVAGDARVRGFLAPLVGRADIRILLTGAGTSSFIGECLAPALARYCGRRVDAISTTDLVASPESWLAADTPTLLVSFARSGNSPESVAALQIVDAYVEHCHHLILTCNPDGALFRLAATLPNAYAMLLPQASNDRSFAMTSSFTGMLLTAAAAFGILAADGARVAALGRLAQHILPGCVPMLRKLVQQGFERVVYLGSKELKGLAREAALKMLELTDGKVVAIADAPLGFRHGPKTILNQGTLVVVFLSSDPYTRRYDMDLLHELRRDAVAGRVVALSRVADLPQHPDNVVLEAAHDSARGAGSLDAADASDLELCLPYAVFAQVLALLRSMSVGVRPDNPNAAGTVSRVVQGVSIHPWQPPL